MRNKSYREQSAPYRKPISTRTNEKVSMFGRIKRSIFGNKPLVNSRQDIRHVDNRRQRVISSTSIPGGFFDANASDVSIVQEEEASKNYKAPESVNNSIADISTSSNAKLANFFAQKGNVPLSEMEMEGVMSLMRQGKSANGDLAEEIDDSLINGTMRSTANNHRDDDRRENSIMKRLDQSRQHSSFKMPSFNPKYDHSTMTIDRNLRSSKTMQRNTSFASTASSTRRVFDYNSLPSPYKTVVFKYKGHSNEINKREQAQTKPIGKIEKKAKKVSNTASALLSLLDHTQTIDSKEDDIISLANPYANNIIPRIREKEETRPVEPEVSKMDTPIQLPKRQNVVESLPKKDETLPKKSSESLPKKDETIGGLNGFSSQKTYKPNRSSSLRSTVTIASPEKEHSKGKEAEPSTKPEEKIIVPQTSTFSFNFTKANDSTVPKKADTSNIFNGVEKPTKLFNFDTTKKVDAAVSVPPVSKYEYDFPTPISSQCDSSNIDDAEVEKYKSLYIF